jgi:hypothetical protein
MEEQGKIIYKNSHLLQRGPRFLEGHAAQAVIKVELFLGLNTYASRYEDVRGRCIVIFTYRPLGETQSQSRHCEEEKNLLLLPEVEPLILSCPARSIVSIPWLCKARE